MELIVTNELVEVIKAVKFEYSTTKEEVDSNGNFKFTSAGNKVYRKGTIELDYAIDIRDRETLYFNGDKIEASNSGNFLSLRRGGTMYIGKDVDVAWQVDSRTKVVRWGRALKPLADAIEKFIDEHVDYSTGSTSVRHAELITEGIKKYLSAESLTMKRVKPSEVYTTKFGDSLGSCMSFENKTKYSNREYIYLYDDIAGCEGCIAYKGDTPVARTLIWNDRHYDKIYGIGHNEKLAFEGLLGAANIEDIQNADETVYVQLDFELSDEEYPYFDSMCYETTCEDTSDVFLTNRDCSGQTRSRLFDLNGDVIEDSEWYSRDVQYIGSELYVCHVSGDDLDEYEDDMVSVYVNGEEVTVRGEYASSCDSCGEYFLITEMETTHNDEYVCNDCKVETYDGLIALDNETVFLEYGSNIGEAALKDDARYDYKEGWMLDADYDKLELSREEEAEEAA